MKFRRILVWLLMVLSAFAYFNLAFSIEREAFALFFAHYSLCFLSFFVIAYLCIKGFKEALSLKYLMVFGLLFRGLFLFAWPHLSDDFFRFFWDGSLLNAGVNPFSTLPSKFAAMNALSDWQAVLLSKMNSPEYHTVYPPLNQFIFYLSVLFGGENIRLNLLVLKGLLFLSEVGIVWLLPKLLIKLKLNPTWSLLYILNPMVVIEVMGNLHFESFTVFFLLVTFWFLLEEKHLISALYFALACSVKLIPILLAPILFRYLGWRKSVFYFMLAGGVFVVLWLPFIDAQMLENFQSSFLLYFRKFEFNASIYYLIRWVGYQLVGYNIIQFSGWILGMVTLLLIIVYAFFQKRKMTDGLFFWMLISFTTFYFLSTTIHPWYLINLLLLGILSNHFLFVIAWCYLAGLSYYTYSNTLFQEHNLLLLIEYALVYGLFIWELILRNKRPLNWTKT